MISVPGKITSVNSNTKKTEVKFEISSEVKFEDLIELQKLIGMRVFADFSNSQQELDDLDDQEEDDDTITDESSNHSDPDQTSIEEFIQKSTEETEQENQTESVESGSVEFSDEGSLPDLAEDADSPSEEIPLPDEQDGPGF